MTRTNGHDPTVSVEKLLRATFGEKDWKRAHLALVPGNPQSPDPATRGAWGGAPAGQMIWHLRRDTNNYVASSLFNGPLRQDPFFERLVILLVDDVGPKIDPLKVEALLGEPTWRLETSPGNAQWGYALGEGVTSAETAKALQHAVRVALTGPDGRDPGQEGLTRYLRLPWGMNRKPELGQPFTVRMLTYSGRQVTRAEIEAWCEKLGVTPGAGTSGPVGTGTKPTGSLSRQAWLESLLHEDPLVQVMGHLGLILNGPRNTAMGRGWDIRCPWAHEHTARDDSGTVYVPHGAKFKCQHGHCVDRTGEHLRARLDEMLRESSCTLDCLVRHEFDVVDVKALKLFTNGKTAADDPWPGASGTGTNGATLWDPWDETPIPVWPGGVMAPGIEDALAAVSEHDGMDLGALAAAFVTAASGAADKRARLVPYAWSNWQVPPILWLALIAESGRLKTPTLEHALRALKQEHRRRFSAHAQAVRAWQLVGDKTVPRPADPMQVLVNDVTVEKLQMLLEDSPRGLLYTRDELAGLLEFGRYSQSGGDSSRGFLLEAYEAGSYTVNRIKRPTVFIANCGLTVIGSIQPARLAGMKGLTDDGLLQRFATVQMGRGRSTSNAMAQLPPPDTMAIDGTLARMAGFVPLGDYHTDPQGAALIRATQERGARLSQGYEYGPGFRGFADKLHGTHARVALVLHMMEDPDELLVPAHTVERAQSYTGFLLTHAGRFYGGMPGSVLDVTRSIASWVLRKGEARVAARELMRGVRACRGKTLKEIQEQVAVLVGADWLRPESAYADNRVWKVCPGVKDAFAARRKSEEERVGRVRSDMNWQGKYR